MAAASRLKGLGADWPPALLAALELETIARYGGKIADGPAPPDVQLFVDKLRELVAEPHIEPQKHLPRSNRRLIFAAAAAAVLSGSVH